MITVIREDDHVPSLREYRAMLLGGGLVVVSAGKSSPLVVGLVVECSNDGAWYEQVPL